MPILILHWVVRSTEDIHIVLVLSMPETTTMTMVTNNNNHLTKTLMMTTDDDKERSVVDVHFNALNMRTPTSVYCLKYECCYYWK